MKKWLIILFFTFSLQTIISQNIQFGIKGGLNYASRILKYDSAIDYNYKIGFQTGGFIKLQLDDKLYLQPELIYSIQGSNYDIKLVSFELPQDPNDPLFQDNMNDNKLIESNIILPIMIKYYLTNHFNIEAGPQIDYLFHIKEKTGFAYQDDGIIISADKNRSVSEFNFGFNVGLGYDFTNNYEINFRYNYGFNQLNHNKNDGLDQKIRNSVFSLSIVYYFN